MFSTLSLQGSVVFVPVPTHGPLGIFVRSGDGNPYPIVHAIEDTSPLEGQVQVGDLLMSLGEHNLLNVSKERVQSMLKGTRSSFVVLRPNNNEAAKTRATPEATSAVRPAAGVNAESKPKSDNLVKKQMTAPLAATDSSPLEHEQARSRQHNSATEATMKTLAGKRSRSPTPNATSTSTSTPAKRSPVCISTPVASANQEAFKHTAATVSVKKEPMDRTTRTNNETSPVGLSTASAPAEITPASKSTSAKTVAPKAPKTAGSETSPIEFLDSDSDIEMEEEVAIMEATKRSIEDKQTQNIGPPTLFSPEKFRFPFTIDTGFLGSSPRDEVLKFRATPLVRSSPFQGGLCLIWPNATPVPEDTGGFYEELTYSTSNNKRRKAGSKTQSRVARLTGLITIHVQISNAEIAKICHGTPYSTSGSTSNYVLAERLWKTIQRSGNPDGFVSKKAQDLFRAIQNLNDMDNLFKERCLFVVAEAPPEPSKLPCVAELKFQVYFRRALFGLAANPNIQTLLDALEPLPQQESWTPCRQCPSSTHQYQQSQRPKAHGFAHSLPGILWANESTGYPLSEKQQAYQGVHVTLRDYQWESVAWMRNQENSNVEQTGGGVAGLNGYFWEKRSFVDGESYYYFPFGGQILMNSPPIVTGGLLAEEMGLGKTVISLEVRIVLLCSKCKLANSSALTRLLLVLFPCSSFALMSKIFQRTVAEPW
jgi:hypothetical protein